VEPIPAARRVLQTACFVEQNAANCLLTSFEANSSRKLIPEIVMRTYSIKAASTAAVAALERPETAIPELDNNWATDGSSPPTSVAVN
jgi:hypothetical protein